MEIEQAIVGKKIRSNREFAGVPKFTEGLIIEDYGTGVTVACELPDNPIPKDKTPAEIAKMWAVNHECPLRDGFDKKDELEFLDLL